MRSTVLARRYAGALFEAARESGTIDMVESDLGLITYSMRSVPRLQEVIEHPLIPGDRKKQIAGEVFQDKIQEITLHFLHLLIDKRREGILDDVEHEYIRLANECRGVVPVAVLSAVPLTNDEQSRLQSKLESYTGRKVELCTTPDESLVGGLTIKIGDTVMDGSVKGYLASLKDRLLGRE